MRINVFRGVVSILGGKVGVLVVGLVTTPILVRILGSSQYGEYAFLLSAFSVTMILVNAGIFDGTRKFMAENRTPNWSSNVFGFYLRSGLGLALLASLTYALISVTELYDPYFGPSYAVYLLLLGGMILTRQASSIGRGGLMGLGLESRSEPLRVVSRLIFVLVGLPLAYVGYDIAGVLVGQITSGLVASSIAFVIVFRRLDVTAVLGRLPTSFPRRELFSFNLWSVVLILLTASLYHIDILLLRPLAGSQATGYYRAALIIAEFLWFVPNALQTALLHSTSEMWSNDESSKITSLVSKITRYNLALLVLLTLGIAALADDFVPLYFGSEFEPTVVPLLLLLPGALGFAVARPIFAVGQGKGALRRLIVATGMAAVMNLCLNLLFIPRWGMSGAAVATSLSYGSMAVFHIVTARKIGFDPINDLRLKKIVLVGLLSAPCIIGVSILIDSALLSLALVPPVGFIVYAGLSVKIGVVSPEEIIDITDRLPEPLSRYSRVLLNPFK